MEAGSGTPGNRRRSPRLSGRPQRQQRQELSQSLLVRKVALAIASDVPLGQHQQYTTNLKRTYCKSVGLDYLQNWSLINCWLQKAVSEGLMTTNEYYDKMEMLGYPKMLAALALPWHQELHFVGLLWL